MTTHTHTDIEELFNDIRSFVKENPGSKVLSADQINPPAFGWVAWIEKDGVEKSVNYTINLSELKNCNNSLIKEAFKTQDGRLALCTALEKS